MHSQSVIWEYTWKILRTIPHSLEQNVTRKSRQRGRQNCSYVKGLSKVYEKKILRSINLKSKCNFEPHRKVQLVSCNPFLCNKLSFNQKPHLLSPDFSIVHKKRLWAHSSPLIVRNSSRFNTQLKGLSISKFYFIDFTTYEIPKSISWIRFVSVTEETRHSVCYVA